MFVFIVINFAFLVKTKNICLLFCFDFAVVREIKYNFIIYDLNYTCLSFLLQHAFSACVVLCWIAHVDIIIDVLDINRIEITVFNVERMYTMIINLCLCTKFIPAHRQHILHINFCDWYYSAAYIFESHQRRGPDGVGRASQILYINIIRNIAV